MKYSDIKYDLYAFFEERNKIIEYCTEDDCSGGEANHNVDDDNLDGTLTLHHFDAMLEYAKKLEATQYEQFVERYNQKTNPYFSKSKVLKFGMLCHLSFYEIENLLNEVGYELDLHNLTDIVYEYFYESQIYDIKLFTFALKDVKDHYGNKASK